MAKDIAMAKDAGVFAVWAQYGANVSAHQYRQLVRVSHWTDDEVKAEAALRERANQVIPDAILHTSFADLLGVVRPWGRDERLSA
jgi:phosphoglycolate phosphatase